MCYGWKMVWLCLLPPSVARKHACTALSVRLMQPPCSLLVDEPGRGAWRLTVARVGEIPWSSLEGGSGTPLLPPTGNPPSNFHFKEVIYRKEQLRVRGRKSRRKKEFGGTEKDENHQKGTKNTDWQHYNETAICNGLLPLRRFGAQSKYSLVERNHLGYLCMVVLWLIFIFIFMLFLHFPFFLQWACIVLVHKKMALPCFSCAFLSNSLKPLCLSFLICRMDINIPS